MREHQNEASNSNSQRPNSFFDWFGWNSISDSHQPSEYSTTHGMYRVGGSKRYSWIDFDRAWYAYRFAATIIYCGLFGIGLGQCLTRLMGVG